MTLQETTKFADKEDYRKFLKEKLEIVSNSQAYNIFLHCVTNYSRYFIEKISNEEEIQKKVEGIFKNGLNLDGTQGYGSYGSINGTARFVGDPLDLNNIETIANYNYFSGTKTINTILIAIPKYIEIEGKLVEFSSLNGDMKNATQHTKACLFDIIKGMFLPIEFILGCQTVNSDNGSYVFYENPKHLAKLPKEEQIKFMDKMAKRCADKLKYCKVKYGAETFEQVFECMTQEHMNIIDEYLNQP